MQFNDFNHYHMYIRRILLNRGMRIPRSLEHKCSLAYAADLDNGFLNLVRRAYSEAELFKAYEWLDKHLPKKK